MATASPENRALIEDLLNRNILEYIYPERMKLERGIILCVCGDCDRFDAIYEFHRRLFIKKGLQPRIHLITLNGGALLISSKSRIVNICLNEDSVIIEHAKAAAEMKGIEDAVLIAHEQCGAASAKNTRAHLMFKWLAEAKIRFKREIPKIKRIYPGFHSDDFASDMPILGAHTKELASFLRERL